MSKDRQDIEIVVVYQDSEDNNYHLPSSNPSEPKPSNHLHQETQSHHKVGPSLQPHPYTPSEPHPNTSAQVHPYTSAQVHPYTSAQVHPQTGQRSESDNKLNLPQKHRNQEVRVQNSNQVATKLMRQQARDGSKHLQSLQVKQQIEEPKQNQNTGREQNKFQQEFAGKIPRSMGYVQHDNKKPVQMRADPSANKEQKEHQPLQSKVDLGNLFPVAVSEENLVQQQVPFSSNKLSTKRVQQNELEYSEEETSQKANRVVGIIILAVIGGIFWIYGWASQFHIVTNISDPVSTKTQPIYGGLLLVTTVFTILGFGLLMMYFKKTSESSLFSSLFIVSFTIIVSPIFHKFWYNVFVTDFKGTIISTQNSSYLLNQSMGNSNILWDINNVKYSLITSISQLVVLLCLFGKLSPIQLVSFSFVYNLLWSLCQYAIINVQNKSPDARFFDDYQISNIYLFGACFGTVSMLIIKKPPNQQSLETSPLSSIFAHLGTFFIFISFSSTSILFSQKNSDSSLTRNFIWQQAFINCFFALSSSVLSTYAFSIVLTDRIEVRQSVFGVIGGAIIYGSVASFCSNIGAAIACGFGAGLFANLYFYFIYYKINQNKIIDNYGVIYILFISMISTVVVAPIVLRVYWKFETILAPLQVSSTVLGSTIANKEVSGYSLAYPGITILIGCSSGLILSLFLKLLDKLDAEKSLTDRIYFDSSHGLRPTKQKEDPKKDKQKRKKINEQSQKTKQRLQQSNRMTKEISHEQKNSQKQPQHHDGVFDVSIPAENKSKN